MGWVNAGEWLEYTVNVAAAGTYNLRLRVARQPTGTSTVSVLFGGVDKTGSLAVPSTGGWQTWTDLNRTGVSLSAGPQFMRISMTGGSFNVNWIEITAASREPDADGHEGGRRQRHRHFFARGHQLRQRLQRELRERDERHAHRRRRRRLDVRRLERRLLGHRKLRRDHERGAIGDRDVQRHDAGGDDLRRRARRRTGPAGPGARRSTSTARAPSGSARGRSNVTYQAWGGLSLRKGTAQSTSGYTALKFWVHGGTGAAKSLRVSTQTADTGGESASVVVSAPANTWTEITVPLGSLGSPASIKRLNIQENSGATQPMMTFDEIRLTP